MVDEPCVCGHGRTAHEYAMKPQCATLLHKRHILIAARCGCLEFRLDNLRYLEALVTERE